MLSLYRFRKSPTFLLASRLFSTCDHCEIEPTVPPAPGTVNEYHHHIFIRLPQPPKSKASQATNQGTWWPDVVERHPILLSAFKTLARHRSFIGEDVKVKITAFETVNPPSLCSIDQEQCDLIMYPSALRYNNLPVSALEATLVSALSNPSMRNLPKIPPAVQALKQDLSKQLLLFVCCHGTRDARCGNLGPPLAGKLLQLVRQKRLEKQISVFQTSHVGGHKYAGNVLAYGPMHPCDGDWFGGLNVDNAPEFMDALLKMEMGVDGGVEDVRLRRWWRGRMGLNKEEQLELFQNQGGLNKDDGNESDWIDEDSEAEGELWDEEVESMRPPPNPWDPRAPWVKPTREN